jgi:holliday junction DNA helicase RuvB
MKFLSLFHKQQETFSSIEGYNDIKDIITRALESKDNYNLLRTGPPASAKTLFLPEIQDKDSVYFDDSNSTSWILDILEQERPKIILIDEIDKMPKQFQNKLLNLMENGCVKVDQKNCQYDFEIKSFKVFATCNDISKLSRPLRSRFRRLHLPSYTQEQFLHISIKICPNLSEDTAMMIGEEVWNAKGDIRDVISISKLIRRHDGPAEISEIISTLKKYGQPDS